jgi:uncharacterized protein YndB with AHSA1/START domain
MKNQLGKISKENNGFKVVFERVLPHPIEKVWNALTNPEELKYWFTDIDLDLKPGEKIIFQFRDKDKTRSYGTIQTVEPPTKLVWTWETEQAVWALSSIDANTTLLQLIYSKIDESLTVNVASGFHDLLDLLAGRLNGSDAIHPFGTEEQATACYPIQVRYAASIFHEYPSLLKSPPLVIEKELNAPIQNVWEALTDKDQMKQWYFTLDDFRAEEGFQFSFPGIGNTGEKYLHRCTVYEVNPPYKLQYSWAYDDIPGFSLVEFNLSESGGKTTLKLNHFGLETFPQEKADFARSSFNGGWNELIGKLLPEYLANH